MQKFRYLNSPIKSTNFFKKLSCTSLIVELFEEKLQILQDRRGCVRKTALITECLSQVGFLTTLMTLVR